MRVDGLKLKASGRDFDTKESELNVCSDSNAGSSSLDTTGLRQGFDA
jgi:hypothetical protein